MAGTEFSDRFKIDRRLGGGESTELFICVDGETDQGVVIKRFRVKPRRARRMAKRGKADYEKNLRARFLDELKLNRQVVHPHVVPVLETGDVDGGYPWFAMPCYPTDLARELWGSPVPKTETAPLPPSRVGEILDQLASALKAVHGAGIVHRDVKPQNVLLDGDGRAVLCDFGQALSPEAPALQAIRNPGTTPFAAPEQRAGNPSTVDSRADIFSLAVLGYLAATGQKPGSPAIRPSDLKDPSIADWIFSAQSPDPEQRPALF